MVVNLVSRTLHRLSIAPIQVTRRRVFKYCSYMPSHTGARVAQLDGETCPLHFVIDYRKRTCAHMHTLLRDNSIFVNRAYLPAMASSSSTPRDESTTKRARICGKILAECSGSKTFLAKTLVALHEAGLLNDEHIGSGGERVVRGGLTRHAERLAAESTPFGPCIQEMNLAGKPWKYIHPLALIYLLSTVSSEFGQIMSDIVAGDKVLSVILYIDEFRPGNVLRPDKGRGTQNVLWIFSDLPDWLICRADAWFQFGCLRSSQLDGVAGGPSALMRLVLKTFFSMSGGPNLESTGGLFKHMNSTVLYKARFGGFLGDEKGMKEVFNSKGPGGMKPCLSCKNICQLLPTAPGSYLQGIAASPSSFDPATDEEVWAMADRLRQINADGSRADLHEAEMAYGLNYCQNSLLFDQELRNLVKPVSGWVRDWMHMLCIGGVANIELEQMLGVLKENNVRPEMITDYFSKFTLPKSRGRIDSNWFTIKRMGRPGDDRDGWKGFAHELLTIVPIMAIFLATAVAPTAGEVLRKHVRCFTLLDKLIKLLSLGGSGSMAHIVLIQDTLREHGHRYSELYVDHIKPKFHHLYHVQDGMRAAGKLMSCWVTERRHRSTKMFANHTFRHYEATLTMDAFNRMIVFAEEGTMYKREAIQSPKELVQGGHRVCHGAACNLVCGLVSKDDVVMLDDRRVGFVESFASTNDDPVNCLVKIHPPVSANRYAPTSSGLAVAPASTILGACIWAKGEESILVLPPPISATW